MVLTHLLSGVVFSLTFPTHHQMDGQNDTGPFYVGLGDRFDDERRLVRDSPPVPPAAAGRTTKKLDKD